MNDQRTFDIIEFTGQDQQYYRDNIQLPFELLASANYVKSSEVAILFGRSSYGGPVVDLPPRHRLPS